VKHCAVTLHTKLSDSQTVHKTCLVALNGSFILYNFLKVFNRL